MVHSLMKLNSSGVPQGSVLGPLLFLIYINDIVKCSKHCEIQLYADDIILHISGTDPQLLMVLMQIDLNEFTTWCKFNSMKINVKKLKLCGLAFIILLEKHQLSHYSSTILN